MDNILNLSFKHLWLIAFFFSLFNYILFFIKELLKKEKKEKIVLNLNFFFVIYYSLISLLLSYIFQILGNYKSGFYLFSGDFKNIYFILGVLNIELPIIGLFINSMLKDKSIKNVIIGILGIIISLLILLIANIIWPKFINLNFFK